MAQRHGENVDFVPFIWINLEALCLLVFCPGRDKIWVETHGNGYNVDMFSTHIKCLTVLGILTVGASIVIFVAVSKA